MSRRGHRAQPSAGMVMSPCSERKAYRQNRIVADGAETRDGELDTGADGETYPVGHGGGEGEALVRTTLCAPHVLTPRSPGVNIFISSCVAVWQLPPRRPTRGAARRPLGRDCGFNLSELLRRCARIRANGSSPLPTSA